MSEPKTLGSNRINLVDTIDYTIELEYNEFFAILHLPKVKKFTKDFYLHAHEKMEQLHQFFGTLGYEAFWVAVYPEDKLNNKFALRLDFEYVGLFEGMNVYKRDT